MSDIYASTDSLHVLDLIGSDYTAFGMDCTAYWCNVSSDMYEYDTSTRLIRVQFIVQPSLEIATCLVYLSSWLRRLRALPSGPAALTTGRRDCTGIQGRFARRLHAMSSAVVVFAFLPAGCLMFFPTRTLTASSSCHSLFVYLLPQFC